MRDAINSDEGRRLVVALVEGRTWDDVRTMLPDVDPFALDGGWKDWCFREAGLELEAETTEAEKKPKAKRGRK